MTREMIQYCSENVMQLHAVKRAEYQQIEKFTFHVDIK